MISKVKFLMSSIYLYLLPMITFLVTKEGEALRKEAKAAVLEIDTTLKNPAITGTERRDAALRIIVRALASAGIVVAKSMIYRVIEIEYEKLGNK